MESHQASTYISFIKDISKVVMFKRLDDPQPKGTTNIEVRISNTPMKVRPQYLSSTGLRVIPGDLVGKRCGSITASLPSKVETFNCSPALSGEYLVLLTSSGVKLLRSMSLERVRYT